MGAVALAGAGGVAGAGDVAGGLDATGGDAGVLPPPFTPIDVGRWSKLREAAACVMANYGT